MVTYDQEKSPVNVLYVKRKRAAPGSNCTLPLEGTFTPYKPIERQRKRQLVEKKLFNAKIKRRRTTDDDNDRQTDSQTAHHPAPSAQAGDDDSDIDEVLLDMGIGSEASLDRRRREVELEDHGIDCEFDM